LEKESDFLGQAVEMLAQMLIECEAEEKIGAGKHERSKNRKAQRNGYRRSGVGDPEAEKIQFLS
jgi:transposase-like protein